jgi:hypothetical protein
VTLNFILGVYNTSSAVNTSLTLIVKYNQGQTQRFSIPFVEYPKATLSIVGVTTPTVRVGDGADYVTLTVKNTGVVPAQFLTFTLLPSDVFQVSVPSSENPLLAVSAVNVSVGTHAWSRGKHNLHNTSQLQYQTRSVSPQPRGHMASARVHTTIYPRVNGTHTGSSFTTRDPVRKGGELSINTNKIKKIGDVP